MLFADLIGRRVCDYEVVVMCKMISGEQVIVKRICHNVSKREAAEHMKQIIQDRYHESLDLNRPIKVVVKSVNEN